MGMTEPGLDRVIHAGYDAARPADVLHRGPEGSARVDDPRRRHRAAGGGRDPHRLREGLHPRRSDRLRRLRRAARASRARRKPARCGSKARSTSSRTATSCTSASTSEQRACDSRLRVAPVRACATTGRLEPPTVTVTDVAIDCFTAPDAKFTVQVKLANRTTARSRSTRIDAELRIENIPVGTAHARRAGPLAGARRGHCVASIARAGPRVVAARERRRSRDGSPRTKPPSPAVRYAVSGMVTLEGGSTIPFSRAGEFKLRRVGGDRTPR